MPPTAMPHLGNSALLAQRKVAFFASRHLSPSAVLPTIEWAQRVVADPAVSLLCGFRSRLEREVLDLALGGTCGIIAVTAGGLYRRIPPHLRSAFEAGRLLFLSPDGGDRLRRPSAVQAQRANALMASLADELVFASVGEGSSLSPLAEQYREKIALTFL